MHGRTTQQSNYISGNAVRRGIKIHEMCEDYLNNMYEDALFETYEKEHFLYYLRLLISSLLCFWLFWYANELFSIYR